MRKQRDLPSSGSTSSGAYNNKRRTKKNDVEDMISHLPDPILHYIFSFLDIKQAIQTCILSKRWRYFWVSHPTLKFSYMQGRKNTIRNEFMDFVDRVLMFRDNSNIHEFALVTNNNIDVTDRLNTWILDIIIHNVQQLTLSTLFAEKFQFHHCLFICKSLKTLVVDVYGNCVSLGLPYSITLPSLKTLFLRSVKFKDEYSTNQLFSGCPILESLTLYRCEFPHINVKIFSPKLQHLRLSYCKTRSNALDLGPALETNFQLCAPNLRSFLWCNNMSIHCAPKNLSSLVKADIRTGPTSIYLEEKAMHAPFLVNFFRGLHNVEDLTLSTALLEVIITGAPDLSDSQPTKFGNLRCLKLTGPWRSVDCFHAISYLVRISPNIEKLFVEVYYPSDKMQLYWNPDKVTSNSAKGGDCWKAGLSLEGLLNHVKCFELRYVTGCINELEFIEILLKNAMLLEELLISLQIPYPYYDKNKELGERRLAKFSEKVLTFPKASSNVAISFKYF